MWWYKETENFVFFRPLTQNFYWNFFLEKELSDLESIRLEAAILQEDNYSENLQNLICNSKLAGRLWIGQ